MRRLLALLLCFATILSLTACGSKGGDSSFTGDDSYTHYETFGELSEVLGYEMLQIEDESLKLIDYASLGNTIGILTYQSDRKSQVALKMTIDAPSNEHISILTDDTQQQGGIQAPSEDFSALNVYIDKDADLCFCPFTYTEDGYTCYLNLSETGTDFNSGFSDRLISFVDQLYQSNDPSGFAVYLDNIYQAEQAAIQAEEDARKAEEEKKRQAEEAARQAELRAKQEEQRKAEEEARQKAEAEKKAKEEAAKKKKEEEAKKKAEEEKKKSDEKTDDKKKDSDKKEDEKKEEEQKDTKPAGKLKLKYYDITLVDIGDYYTFEPGNGKAPYTWKSADPKIATVDKNGRVTAVSSGRTTITVVSKDNYQATIDVYVKG